MVYADLWCTNQSRTASYGWRNLPGFGQNFHQGQDFAYGRNVPVTVCGAGTVVIAGWHNTYGNHVRVRHAAGIETSYHALQTINVRVGQSIGVGGIVGGAGSSAQGSTGPHLHLGFWINGTHADPMIYLRQGQTRRITLVNGRATTAAVTAGQAAATIPKPTPVAVPKISPFEATKLRKKNMIGQLVTNVKTGKIAVVSENSFIETASSEEVYQLGRVLREWPGSNAGTTDAARDKWVRDKIRENGGELSDSEYERARALVVRRRSTLATAAQINELGGAYVGATIAQLSAEIAEIGEAVAKA